LIFALAVALFHFANTAMLPLAGQLLSTGKTTDASLYTSACIIPAGDDSRRRASRDIGRSMGTQTGFLNWLFGAPDSRMPVYSQR